jgi:hypothetical protein
MRRDFDQIRFSDAKSEIVHPTRRLAQSAIDASGVRAQQNDRL